MYGILDLGMDFNDNMRVREGFGPKCARKGRILTKMCAFWRKCARKGRIWTTMGAEGKDLDEKVGVREGLGPPAAILGSGGEF